MAQIIPTPSTGSWLHPENHDGTWTPTPSTGSWLKLGNNSTWEPGPQTGSWWRLDGWIAPPGGWRIGIHMGGNQGW